MNNEYLHAIIVFYVFLRTYELFIFNFNMSTAMSYILRFSFSQTFCIVLLSTYHISCSRSHQNITPDKPFCKGVMYNLINHQSRKYFQVLLTDSVCKIKRSAANVKILILFNCKKIICCRNTQFKIYINPLFLLFSFYFYFFFFVFIFFLMICMLHFALLIERLFTPSFSRAI